jgi:putative effector of murein hydrolase
MTDLTAFLAAVAATLAAYLGAQWLHLRTGGAARLHPALVACLGLGAGLALLGIDHAAYFAAWPLHAALVPMTVLLAVPLHRQRDLILQAFAPIAAIVALGCVTGLALSAAPALLGGRPRKIVLTLVAASVTTAVAVGIAERTGGIAELAPAIVIATGIVGACLGPPLCRALRVTDDRAVGLALGIAAHAIGTARAFQISQTAGAFATLGLILNAILTSAAIALALA